MPLPYTPSPQLAASDPPLPDGPVANLALFRALLDGRRHLRGATWALLTGPVRFEARGTAAAPVLTVGPIEAVTLRDGAGVWRPYFALTDSVLGLAQVEGAPAALAANTWHYVYAHDAAGVGAVQWQVSTVGPGASLAWKDVPGVALYRLVACFVTDGAGRPLPGVSVAGCWTYRASACAGGDLALAARGRSTAWAPVDLARQVPPHARTVRLRVDVARAAADLVGIVELRCVGDAGAIEAAVAPPLATIDTRAHGGVDVPLPTRAVEYRLVNAVTDDPAYGVRIAVVGWT